MDKGQNKYFVLRTKVLKNKTGPDGSVKSVEQCVDAALGFINEEKLSKIRKLYRQDHEVLKFSCEEEYLLSEEDPHADENIPLHKGFPELNDTRGWPRSLERKETITERSV